ncbi:hypothetical protein VDGL01_08712 [Verticillium dahliae]
MVCAASQPTSLTNCWAAQNAQGAFAGPAGPGRPSSPWPAGGSTEWHAAPPMCEAPQGGVHVRIQAPAPGWPQYHTALHHVCHTVRLVWFLKLRATLVTHLADGVCSVSDIPVPATARHNGPAIARSPRQTPRMHKKESGALEIHC